MPINVRTVKMESTDGAVSWDIPIYEGCLLDRIALVFSAAPDATENITVSIDSREGDAFDHVIATDDPKGDTTVTINIDKIVAEGDSIIVAYPNTDENDITAIAYFEI